MTSDNFRIEVDALGKVYVENDKFWGAQTQRSIENFDISRKNTPMCSQIIKALALIKKSAAKVNIEYGLLDKSIGNAIQKAADKIIAGTMNSQFPLSIWQSGSGTQTNMNVNEVISNLAIELLGGAIGTKDPVHPNDHVNLSQSSNDTFPTAVHIAIAQETHQRLLPALIQCREIFNTKTEEFSEIIKTGRTHLQDATPITLGQEFSAFADCFKQGINLIADALISIYEIAQGGTAVGTGLNTLQGFDDHVAEKIREFTRLPFRPAQNKFYALSSRTPLLQFSSALNAIACDVHKIANDIRLLSSGPRCGIGEIILPSNEPGSSIMPGKVNPTQCEAATMVAVQVMGNHYSVAMGASNGQLQLNVYTPLIAYNTLQSIEILSDMLLSFSENCIQGIIPNYGKIKYNIENSLMSVTALNPLIGYDNSGEIAKFAHEHSTTLKEAAKHTGLISDEDFDKCMVFANMTSPTSCHREDDDE